ncbi:MAG TPA: beta-propeller fold lactonase family protein [Candidatus Methylomirabilis sp.]|nr:beta-propeller fold lactonase family protein [Candidatus Methylomirabilis sp.]
MNGGAAGFVEVAKIGGLTVMLALAWLAGGSAATAGTFVYVSNADDGDISAFTLKADGELQPGPRVKAASVVMPMTVSPDRRFLYAASRSKPYAVHAYSIDSATGGLTPLGSAPLVDSFPYISLDRTGRFLFGASYGSNLISVNPVGADGRVAVDPLQIIAIGRNAHSILVDATNRFVFVPTLGTDQIFEFTFDAKSGYLTSNTPPILQMKIGTGPRHFVFSRDNRFAYVLSELLATVTTLSLDTKTGLLIEVSSASGLPPDSKLGPGAPRGTVGGPNVTPRNTDNDIWAADIHLTPDERFLYISERTSSSLSGFGVDKATGTLTYLSTTPTEKQPRGFAIDPTGRFLVASGEKSPTISVYAIDPANGALRLLRQYPTGKGANWVEIVSFD